MKLPFTKPKPEFKAITLQDLQQQFNQVMFELGDLHYRKHMINAELAKINSEINTRAQKADNYGLEAAKLRKNMEQEVANKVEEGNRLEVVKDEVSE